MLPKDANLRIAIDLALAWSSTSEGQRWWDHVSHSKELAAKISKPTEPVTKDGLKSTEYARRAIEILEKDPTYPHQKYIIHSLSVKLGRKTAIHTNLLNLL
jgi:hypothetical protein